MAAQTSWVNETPKTNQTASYELEDAALREAKPEDEVRHLRLPSIVGNSAALGRVLTWCGWWRRPAPPC